MAAKDSHSARVMARAGAARARSYQLRGEVERLNLVTRRTLGEQLITRTTRLDAGFGSEIDRARIGPLSRIVGRDPIIEDAKALLAGRHGITTGEAFELLRQISMRRNRKLRDVAHAFVDAEFARTT